MLAWSILPIILMAIGSTRSVHPAHASTRTASSTQVILTSLHSAPAAPLTAAKPPATKYVVRYGDSLTTIATRFGVHGGWPALYAANRRAIGPDPNTIQPGGVLLLPSRTLPARYTVAAGDTLSGIAARLALPGGWLALYEANWQAIGPDPNVIHSGTVLTVPRPAAPSPPAPGPAHQRPHPPPPPSLPSGAGHHHPPSTKGTPTATGTPQWLKTMLPAVGLVIVVAFLAEPVLAVCRRRRQAAGRAVQLGNAGIGSRRDRGSRSRSVAAAVRPVAVAARVHPVGVAVPSAVLVTGIVLFTFVESATMRVVPPQGGSGPGSVSAARPGDTGQPHHRLRSRQPGPPAAPALPSSPGQCRRLTGILEQNASPLPVPAAVPPTGPGRAPQASRNRSSRLPGGLVCAVKQVPSSAATAAAGSEGAGQ
jgi:LysM repeat protein